LKSIIVPELESPTVIPMLIDPRHVVVENDAAYVAKVELKTPWIPSGPNMRTEIEILAESIAAMRDSMFCRRGMTSC
jgi:HAMP domain-containing protein